jgi:hypothetical protein
MSKSLSQRKAAVYLGIAPSTLSAYCRAGHAPRHVALPGGARRFDVCDLDTWRAARTVEGA